LLEKYLRSGLTVHALNLNAKDAEVGGVRIGRSVWAIQQDPVIGTKQNPEPGYFIRKKFTFGL
jgi:hypothetical protein